MTPTIINVGLMMLARFSTRQAGDCDQYYYMFVACLGLLSISEPLLWVATLIYARPVIMKRIKSERVLFFDILQITAVTLMVPIYTTYTGRYCNAALSFGSSGDLSHAYRSLLQKWSLFYHPNTLQNIKHLLMLQYRN